LAAFSGVTNTIDALSGGLRPVHVAHRIPNFSHRCAMSFRNAFNGTTTTVTPLGSTHAGNMNNMLLPAPVGMTATMGLSPLWTASIASACTLWNDTSFCIIRPNSAVAFIYCNRIRLFNRSSPASSSNGHLFRFKSVFSSLIQVDSNPKNRCQSVLTARNYRLRSAVVLDISMLFRAYINPAMCGECVACSSAALLVVFSFSHSSFLSS